jgi:AcrR family transcriptional regulator
MTRFDEPEAALKLAARELPLRDGRARRHPADFQRMRILSAMGTAACEYGVQSVTVSHVVAQAGVSRKTFYEFFDNCSACFLALLEHIVALIAQRTRPVYQRERAWIDRIRAALQIILEFLDEDRVRARLCIVESAAAGPTVIARRQELLNQLAQVVDEGRKVTRRKPAPLVAEGAVGGAFEVIHARLLKSNQTPLVGLLGQLMSCIALPYLGCAAAQRELDRPLIASASGDLKLRSERSQVETLPMRLTYRTVTVLGVIASRPGLNNAQISRHADVTDQGQISRLLRRLAGLQLIEDHGAGGSGSLKAWRLTHRGEAVARTINSPART